LVVSKLLFIFVVQKKIYPWIIYSRTGSKPVFGYYTWVKQEK